jgi:hypothetical protein
MWNASRTPSALTRLIAATIAAAAGSCNCTRAPQPSATGVQARAASAVATQAAVLDEPRPGSVVVHLETVMPPVEVVSFGVPLPPGRLRDVADLRVRTLDGAPLQAQVKELLAEHDAAGARVGVRSAVVQLPATALVHGRLDVRVDWTPNPPAEPPGTTIVAFASESVSAASPATADVANWAIHNGSRGLALRPGPITKKVLFTGREPRVTATFPPGYLAETGILGELVSLAAGQGGRFAGLRYLSDAFRSFATSAMYVEGYPLNPDKESVIDPVADYSGWLYDRCATFLSAYAHLDEPRLLRHALRSCSYYSGKIRTEPPNAGIFSGKPDPDAKYSHLRGLYVYYAMTGDEAALGAGQAIAAMWQKDPLFVLPYAAGHVRGPDKLWTERLLATSLEGLYYGHRLTGDPSYLKTFEQLLTTAYRHITGDRAALAKINPGVTFPPQDCFIHTAEQQSEGDATDPWCSPWMSELLVDPLLRYQEQTGDERVDEIFIRLGRFLRDTGTAYFTNDVLKDSFLEPSICDDDDAGERRRRLVPLYGAGRDTQGKRRTFGEYSDFEHCADATSLAAVALRALERRGLADKGPLGTFPNEGASMLALFHELSVCAKRTFTEQTRLRRDPRTWTPAELAPFVGDPKFIGDNRIGFPVHVESPQRKLSWWFNTSILQVGILADTSISVPFLSPGQVEPPRCRKTPIKTPGRTSSRTAP